MTPKWTIRKYAVSSLGDEVALPWLLFEPGVSPPKLFHEAYWAACSMEETFNEVLAYMKSRTRKARTVEVELPKVEDWKVLPSKRQIVDQLAWGAIIRDTTSDYEDSGGYVYIDDSDLKPLGEYLLALHYEKENDEATQRSLPEF